jgi:GR25 family glycosyltransferase involved in LPS biosynthesis
MVKKLNVYFIHAKFVKEREQVIENFKKALKKYRFRDIVLGKFFVITEYDPDAITSDVISKFVKYERITENHVEFYNQLLKNMHVNQLSNTLKHMKALSLIAKNSNDNEINIVLEDDVLYEDKVCASLEKLVDQLPKPYDIVFLGFPTVEEPKDTSKFIFQDTHKLFKIIPFCDSYIVSRSAAKAISANYTPVKFCNNVQLSYICDKIGINTMQSVPNIFIDGTKYGLFLSKLTANNPLIFNGDFTKLRNLVVKEEYSEQDHQEVKALLTNSQIRNNPDLIHMECLYHMKCKNYEKARERYELAYKTYLSNGCMLSNESVFLRDYIKCHKYLQSDIEL